MSSRPACGTATADPHTVAATAWALRFKDEPTIRDGARELESTNLAKVLMPYLGKRTLVRHHEKSVLQDDILTTLAAIDPASFFFWHARGDKAVSIGPPALGNFPLGADLPAIQK